MLNLATCLRYYKREYIQKAIIKNAEGRELAVKYGIPNEKGFTGFGKRPDAINYPREVLEFAKNGVTSFHVSEERWENPLDIQTGMKRKELDKLRTGWDLIIDIDSKVWQISKVATWLIVKTLNELGIESATVKFSGNKGFHIAVPFESFPEQIEEQNTKDFFPEFPKMVASYLIEEINDRYIRYDMDSVIFADQIRFTIPELLSLVETKEPLIRCKRCKKAVKDESEQEKKVFFVCPACENQEEVSEETDFLVCKKCSKMMERIESKDKPSQNQGCPCGSNETELNPLAIIDIDTLLISSRHMYRCVYSLHEKSGLASIPVKDVMAFEKEFAHPDKIEEVDYSFLDCKKREDATDLLTKSIEHDKKMKIFEKEIDKKKRDTDFEFVELQDKAPVEFFPPCIKKILEGIEDGKKRALFIIHNFLQSVGWSHEDIQDMMKEWNEKNPEPLREALIEGHIRYHKTKKVLPPNCDNQMYYKDLQLCFPDNLCEKVKNPVNYTRRKVFANRSDAKKPVMDKDGKVKSYKVEKDYTRKRGTRMKFYLSSFKLGDKPEELMRLLGENKKIGYIPNAGDYPEPELDFEQKNKFEEEDIKHLKDLGLEVEYLDLKNYFGKEDELKRKLETLGGVFIRGGNTFILRQAMKLSGFDNIFNDFLKRDDFVYAGYSAALCVLGADFRAIAIVDKPNIIAYEGIEQQIWEGLGYFKYTILPHYKSDHPESVDIDKEVENCEKNKLPYKTLRDGEVIVIE